MLYHNLFPPYIFKQRGGVLIQKWGRSSAASTAVSIVDAIRSLVTPTPEGDWFSSGVSFDPFKLFVVLFWCFSEGKIENKTQVYTTGNPYGIAEDIVFSMPCRSKVQFRIQVACITFVPRIRLNSNDLEILPTG